MCNLEIDRDLNAAINMLKQCTRTLVFLDMSKGAKTYFISELVLIELEGCNPAKRSKLYGYLRQVDYNLIFLTEEISNLAEKYINSAIIPQKFRSDALHIAAATVSNCDFLVSWNFKHIVRAKTILGVNGINKLTGYKEIQIVSPNMLVDEE